MIPARFRLQSRAIRWIPCSTRQPCPGRHFSPPRQAPSFQRWRSGILRQLKHWTIGPFEERFWYVLFLPGYRFQEPCCNRSAPLLTGRMPLPAAVPHFAHVLRHPPKRASAFVTGQNPMCRYHREACFEYVQWHRRRPAGLRLPFF